MKHSLATALFATFVAFSFAGIASAEHHAAPAKDAAKKEGAAAPAAPAGKEVTLKGTMTCGKCGLKETAKCQNVLKATEGGKEVAYYLTDNAIAKGGHGKVCSGTAPATVKGTVGEAGGKKTLTASEIKYE